jgi:hypothetical protein
LPWTCTHRRYLKAFKGTRRFSRFQEDTLLLLADPRHDWLCAFSWYPGSIPVPGTNPAYPGNLFHSGQSPSCAFPVLVQQNCTRTQKVPSPVLTPKILRRAPRAGPPKHRCHSGQSPSCAFTVLCPARWTLYRKCPVPGTNMCRGVSRNALSKKNTIQGLFTNSPYYE